jgi:DNA mismatch repair protein MutH
MKTIDSPQTDQELLSRACRLAGLTLAQVSTLFDIVLPSNLTHGKGIVGQMIETALGATAGSKSRPDFENLGIELKTIPINQQGKPSETTYVCTVPMLNISGLTWRNSCVYRKLAKVLWIPIQASPLIPIPDRKIGMPLLWQMTDDVEKILQQDWEELIELVSLGKVETVTAKLGVYLQIRPKAADSKAVRMAVGADGAQIQTLPRGFYLRTTFTEKVLRENYL